MLRVSVGRDLFARPRGQALQEYGNLGRAESGRGRNGSRVAGSLRLDGGGGGGDALVARLELRPGSSGSSNLCLDLCLDLVLRSAHLAAPALATRLAAVARVEGKARLARVHVAGARLARDALGAADRGAVLAEALGGCECG